jgi:hypothetical protein
MNIRVVGSLRHLTAVATSTYPVQRSIHMDADMRARRTVAGCAAPRCGGFVAALAGELLVRHSGEPLETEVGLVIPGLHALGSGMETGREAP